MKFEAYAGMGKLPVPGKLTRGRECIMQTTGNPNFPTPIPTMATLATLVNQAEAAYLQAKAGGPDDTAMMRVKVAALELAMKQFVGYVEAIANQNPATADAVIRSAGLFVKTRTTRQTSGFSVFPTGNPGEAKVVYKGVSRGSIEVQMSTDITSDANWRTIYMGTRGRIVRGELAVNTRYYFRARMITKNGPSEWSEVRIIYLPA
jgi:hypothetical protein